MKPRVQFIRKAARQLLTQCKVIEPPVDLIAIAKYCGLEYQEVDYFEDNVDALIVPFDGRVVAAVNQKSPPNRRRFSLAHELCHHLHHKDRASLGSITTIDSPPEYFSETIGKDPFETEADMFAGELLVPLPMLKKYYSNGQTVADLASIFLVSQEVVSIAITSHFSALHK